MQIYRFTKNFKMRSFLLLLGFVGLLIQTSTAQVTSISSINVGISASTGFSFIAAQNNYGNSEMEYRMTPGYTAGVLGNINWYGDLGLQIEGQFAFLGQDYEDIHDNNTDVRLNLTLTYWQIPLLLKYTNSAFSSSYNGPNFYILGGPQFSFVNNVYQQYFRNGVRVNFPEAHQFNPIRDQHPEFIEDDLLFRKFEIGIIAALGFEFPLANDMYYFAEFRNYVGLTDINVREWRFPDRNGNYSASRHYYFSLRMGVTMEIW